MDLPSSRALGKGRWRATSVAQEHHPGAGGPRLLHERHHVRQEWLRVSERKRELEDPGKHVHHEQGLSRAPWLGIGEEHGLVRLAAACLQA